MNKKKFDSMDKSQRDFLIEVMEQMERRAYEIQTKEQAQQREELLKVGMEEIKFSEKDEQWFLKMAYTEGWKGAIERVPKVEKLRPLISK
jgi:TRAP-type C4-dicarboxylate transport system substrate-binding protein